MQSGQTVPALVQALARSGTERLRADFAAQGMPGLRPLHAVLLVPLLGGGRHASDLAETLGVTRQAVAQVVTRLEQDGYLTRVTDPGDARAKLICLTPRGRAALRTMRATALPSRTSGGSGWGPSGWPASATRSSPCCPPPLRSRRSLTRRPPGGPQPGSRS